eukprot:376014-Pyramimonas_sp.AAC.1
MRANSMYERPMLAGRVLLETLDGVELLWAPQTRVRWHGGLILDPQGMAGICKGLRYTCIV